MFYITTQEVIVKAVRRLLLRGEDREVALMDVHLLLVADITSLNIALLSKMPLQFPHRLPKQGPGCLGGVCVAARGAAWGAATAAAGVQ